MKGEERIIELLSEYLKKSDRHEDEMKQNQEEIKKLREDFNRKQEDIEKLREDFNQNQEEIKKKSGRDQEESGGDQGFTI